MNQNDFGEFNPAKVVIYKSIYSSDLAFRRASWNFAAFKTSLKFGFLVQHFATFLFVFSVWFFEMKFNPLPDLLNNGFTTIEIGLLWRTLATKTKQIPN